WQDHRNAAQHPVNWRFTTDGARIKLKSLYPSIYKVDILVAHQTSMLGIFYATACSVNSDDCLAQVL
ncbi:MAG: hypothetical protein OXC62_12080, partial [Aestuariivita sp.]|nr:hypothetical protein [Aestuariivita sp.]